MAPSLSCLYLAQVQKTLKEAFVILKAVVVEEPSLVCSSMLIKLSLLLTENVSSTLGIGPQEPVGTLKARALSGTSVGS